MMTPAVSKNMFKIQATGFDKIRQQALDFLQNSDIPGRKSEEYRYTPIAQTLQKHFPDYLSSDTSSLNSVDKIDLPKFDCHYIILINGFYKPELSSIPDTLEVGNLGESNNKVTGLIGSVAPADGNFFIALNTVLFNGGLSINVPESTKIDKPVSIINITDSSESKTFCSPRIAISLNKNSNISFYEFCYSIGDNPSFSNNVIEIFVAESSSGNFTQLQLNGENTSSHHSVFIEQKRNSLFNSNMITLGGFMVRNNLTFILDDENIESHLNGLYLAGKNQHFDNHTVVDHRMPNSYSNELYKGILMDKAKCVFNGKIYVRPNAQKTNAYQSNKNILLSDDATIYTKPQLEIWADDVKCSHGCTTGQLDEEQIFYLRSRGINRDTAIAMVLNAFQHDILNKIPDAKIIEYLDEIITEKIGKIY